MPDTNPNIPNSELAKQLAAEATLAKLRKDIAQAREGEAKAAREAWKGTEAKALEGKTTATGNFIEGRILANMAMMSAFEKLINKITQSSFIKDITPTFVIYKASDFPILELYVSMLDQLDALRKVCEEVIANAKSVLGLLPPNDASGGIGNPILVGFAAASVLRTAADIFSLFKTNTTVNNFEIASEEALIVTFFSNVIKNKGLNWKIYFPAAYPVKEIQTENNESSTNFILSYTQVKVLNNEILALKVLIEKKIVENEEKLMTEADTTNKKNLQNENQALNTILPRLLSTSATFNQLENVLFTFDPTTNMTTQSMILRAERLTWMLRRSDTFVIKLLADSNGSSQIKEHLFRFSKVLHSGGTNLSCLIFSSDGSILFADNSYSYIPYKESAEIIEDTPNKKVEDTPNKKVEDAPNKKVEDAPNKKVNNAPGKKIKDVPSNNNI